MSIFSSNTPCPECGCLTAVQIEYPEGFRYECDVCKHVHDGEGRFLAVQAAKALQAQGVDVVEVISTPFQTGAEYRVIRPWDGAPSMIGSLQVRNGRPDGKEMTGKGRFYPHIGAAA